MSHYRQVRGGKETRPIRYKAPQNPGEWSEWQPDSLRYTMRRRINLETRRTEKQYLHRVVMEEKLGRPLIEGENVHHINGVRSDNRPENLELWVTKQPRGQRPADLVDWAKEILALYGAEV